MKRKNGFPFLLALAFIFASAPVAAHAAQQKAASPPQAAQPASPQLNPADQRDAQQTIIGPYRLTYTVTELDGNKRIGSQRYAIVLDAGYEIPSAALKLGTKIPIESGRASSTSQIEVSYIDVGLNIDASLRLYKNGLELRSHIVQSAVDNFLPPLPLLPPSGAPLPPLPPPTPSSSPTQPVIRQTDFRNTVLLNENKPITIGNVDMPGTTHVLQIQVEVTKLP